jgi:RNA 2',3'-cyclic 3'-phosphodiesterase
VTSARLRLFVAVGVPAAVQAAVADAVESLRGEAAEARWTDPASWHLTLAFLGAVDAERVDALAAVLAPVAARHAPVDLALTGTARMFGRRVLWAELEASPALGALAGEVRDALEPLGFAPDDRPFAPHLTLARARKGGSLPRGLADAYAGPVRAWRVEHLDLMRSHLQRAGARYERVLAWPLAAGR